MVKLSRVIWMAVSVVVMAACSSTAPSPSTGLTGVVVRGPVTPVCRVDVPCDAPFSATFNVERSGRRVTQFQSDTAGRFTVMLSPGVYSVIPNADAPVISPASQAKSVMVADNGMLTVVLLTFDTGIR
jgi:hypothetical protein